MIDQSIDRFFEQLGTLKGQFSVNHVGAIRHCQTGDCPILAVARLQGKLVKDRGNAFVELYGAQIGLYTEDALEIARAADFAYRQDPALRARLLQTVGLEGEAQPPLNRGSESASCKSVHTPSAGEAGAVADSSSILYEKQMRILAEVDGEQIAFTPHNNEGRDFDR